MQRLPILLAFGFVIGHIALVAPFVPLANILPAGLGAIAMSSMALSLVLAARWRIVDYLMGGPDKSYIAHRYFGFFTLLGTLGHWALASDVGMGSVPHLAELGGEAGNIAAFGIIAMASMAMIRAIPYHIWKLSHMLMGPIFLVAVFHTFFVASPMDIGEAPWFVMVFMSSLGGLGWVQTLLRKIFPATPMHIEKITHFEGGVDVLLRSRKKLPAFKPGQFATLMKNDRRAESHPFTIAGGDETSRRFVIRSAGDWTQNFADHAKIGDEMLVGRAAGQFLPMLHKDRQEQLWVAGGVGITPFLATLEKATPDHHAKITLVYGIRSRETAGVVSELEHHAARLPQFELVLCEDDKGQMISSNLMRNLLINMAPNAEAYLCGPEGLKNIVQKEWIASGKEGQIHSERFDFRGAWGLTQIKRPCKALLETFRITAERATRQIRHAPAGS